MVTLVAWIMFLEIYAWTYIYKLLIAKSSSEVNMHKICSSTSSTADYGVGERDCLHRREYGRNGVVLVDGQRGGTPFPCQKTAPPVQWPPRLPSSRPRPY